MPVPHILTSANKTIRPSLSRRRHSAVDMGYNGLYRGLVHASVPMMNSMGKRLIDLSPFNKNGDLTNGAAFVNDYLSLTRASNHYVNYPVSCGNFERTDKFSVVLDCTPLSLSSTEAEGYVLVGKWFGANATGWGVYIDAAGNAPSGNDISIYLINTYPANALEVRFDNAIANSNTTRQHIVVTYNGNSNASGVTLYLNGIQRTLSTITNTLSASIISAGNLQLGARPDNTTTSTKFNGRFYSFLLYNRVLSAHEVRTLHRDPLAPFRQPRVQNVANVIKKTGIIRV
jgi:hypothetical protein